MKDSEILQQYIDMMPFLSKILGNGVELVIHDVSNPEHSIIAIQNPLSERQIGDPLTDLAESLLNEHDLNEKDYITNYDGKTKNADFLSSTYFIKNSDKVIGLLCINKEISDILNLENAYQKLINDFNLNRFGISDYSENLNKPIDKLMHKRISDAINDIGIPPERMTVDERTTIVQKLSDNGVLSMKNAVAETAYQLGVSIPTIYRYINRKLK